MTTDSSASYTTLCADAIVSIQLPKHVSPRTIKGEDDIVLASYLHWRLNLPGGVVNMHVHADDIMLANTTIRARAEVKIKTTESGREFLFVDFYPVDKSVAPTHKLVVLPDTFEQLDHWQIFPTPGMHGFAALIEPNEKLVQPSAKFLAPTPVAVSKQRRATHSGMYSKPVEGNRPFAALLDGVGK